MTLRAIAKQETLKRDTRIVELLTRRKNRLSVKAVASMFHLSDKSIYAIMYKRAPTPGTVNRKK